MARFAEDEKRPEEPCETECGSSPASWSESGVVSVDAGESELPNESRGTSETDEAVEGLDLNVRKIQDSLFFPEDCGSWNLPVQGAKLYNSRVEPVPLPSGKLKIIVFVIFWAVCYGFHKLQRHLQLSWNVPGESGQTVNFPRSMPGEWQVAINIILVISLSAYAVAAYVFHQKILDNVLNHLFMPRSWLGSMMISWVFFAIALVSSFYLTVNWVAAAAGLFMFFGFAVCGRTVQETVSARGQIGLGPSRSGADAGRSFHVDGENAEIGQGGKGMSSMLIRGEAGTSAAGMPLRFAHVQGEPFTLADDAVLVAENPNGTFTYQGPCGRANIFRLDCLLVLILSFGVRLPWFVLGGGGFNQCAGVVELVASLIYIPIGYTCFAVFGFRVGLACRWSVFVVVVYCLWPFVNLVLGGKGCATLTDLVAGEHLPQIWNCSANAFQFNRGFATCSESAYALGGESMLVASTTIAAWVHIMSNFSFLYGFINGMAKLPRSRRCFGAGERDAVIM